MKLYSYSSESLKFIEAKWFIAKYTISGILLGTIILFCAIKLDQSIRSDAGFYPANTLASENGLLRQQVNLISPRVSSLEMQAKQLNERADELHKLLPSRNIVRDSVLNFTSAAKEFKLQYLTSAAKNFRH